MHSNSDDSPTPRIGRQEKRQQTRAALFESALREFAHFGVSGTSAERIAEAAGFSRGAFYANFENKQELLLELITHRITTEQASWVELSESSLELDDLLDTFNDRTLRFDPEGLWTMISAETYLYALRDPDFAERYRAYHDAVRGTFARIVGNLFLRAGKRPPLPIDDLCDGFFALSRTLRLPPAGSPGTAPQPMPSSLLFVLIRGVIAIAPTA